MPLFIFVSLFLTIGPMKIPVYLPTSVCTSVDSKIPISMASLKFQSGMSTTIAGSMESKTFDIANIQYVSLS